MGVKLAAASGGSVELVPTNTASNYTATMPAATGNVVLDSATQTLTNKTLTTPNINSAQIATVSGTAPLYMCRAWVSFNGLTISIYGSANVSSITDNGTGDYTVNFTTAMPDANYCVTGISSDNPTINTVMAVDNRGISASSIRVGTFVSNSPPTVVDRSYNFVSIIR